MMTEDTLTGGPFATTLMRWFAREGRKLPWRHPALTTRRDPYAVLVSETMLQQTQVTTVLPYFDRFMRRFPTVKALAEAEEETILKLWEGLGYYRRARLLHRCARSLMAQNDGVIPVDREALLALPGVGPYTAGAIRAFAFDQPEPAVDGNVVRVLARLDAVPHVRGTTKAARAVRERVRALMPPRHPGDFAEALMELGAVVCTPASPRCDDCPVSTFCRAYAVGDPTSFPLRKDAAPRPREAISYALLTDGTHVCAHRRPPGFLGGLYEFMPLVGDRRAAEADLAERFPGATIRHVADRVSVFSHKIWDLSLFEVHLTALPEEMGPSCRFTPEALAALPFPAFLAVWRDEAIARLSD